jgi:copper(I)-binding protein
MQILKLFFLVSLLAACEAKTNAEANAESHVESSAKTEVIITEYWARESAPGQSVGAAYMTLNSPQDNTLIYVETPVAGSVEIHSMSMDNGVMKMRMLEELSLKAGQPEKLAPGGFHLMLFDLKAPLKAGESVPLKLRFKDKGGSITHQNVTLPVKSAY